MDEQGTARGQAPRRGREVKGRAQHPTGENGGVCSRTAFRYSS